MSLLQKIFGRPVPAAPTPTSSIVAAAAHGEDTAAAEYREFCDTFYVKPRVKFIDFIRRHRVQPLDDWLRPETTEAEPKALVRMMLQLTKEGTQIWDVPGLSLYLQGRWDQGGGPSPVSRDAISQFAQVIGKPVKVFYRVTEDGPEQVLEFAP